jgi:hypothetical protein
MVLALYCTIYVTILFQSEQEINTDLFDTTETFKQQFLIYEYKQVNITIAVCLCTRLLHSLAILYIPHSVGLQPTAGAAVL